MKKFFLLGFLASLLLAGCTQPAVSDQPIRVALLPVLDSLPLYVAQQQGYFEDAGLKVGLVRWVRPGARPVDAIRAEWTGC